LVLELFESQSHYSKVHETILKRMHNSKTHSHTSWSLKSKFGVE